MNITLIDSTKHNSYVGTYLRNPPLGLLYIAGGVTDIADKVRIFDQKLPNKEIIEDTDILGATSIAYNLGYILDFLQKVKQINPQITTVIGGQAATLYPRVVDKKYVDHIVLREGEVAFRKLVLGERKDRLIEEPLANNLDDLPLPAYNLVNVNQYHLFGISQVTLESSRGCPMRCTFCATRMFYQGKYRLKSIPRVIKEIESVTALSKKKIGICFVDDNHSQNVKRAMRLCNAIIENGFDDRIYSCMSRVDTLVKHPELVKRMVDAGYGMVYLGVESPYQASLESYAKGTTWERIKSVVKLLNDHGIIAYGSVLIGNPNETEEMMRQYPKYMQELKVSFAQFNMLVYNPNPAMYQNGVPPYRVLLDESNVTNLEYYDGTICTFKHPLIDPRRLNKIYLNIVNEYFSDIRNYYPLISNLLKIGSRMFPRRLKRSVLNFIKNFQLLRPSTNLKLLQKHFSYLYNDVYDCFRIVQQIIQTYNGKLKVSEKYIDQANKRLTEILDKESLVIPPTTTNKIAIEHTKENSPEELHHL